MTDRAAQEIEAVKRLLVLLLMKLGTKTDEIGMALDVSGQRVRQIVHSAKVAKFTFVKAE